MMLVSSAHGGPLVRPAVVAAALGVHVRTLRRWADARLLTVQRTPGGHRRYVAAEVAALVSDRTEQAARS